MYDDPTKTRKVERMELMSEATYNTSTNSRGDTCCNKTKRALLPSSCKEGVLCIATFNLFILVFVLAILLNTSSGAARPELCESAACVQLAATLVSNMNRTVDPCEDFYEYTCGNWGQRNPIPDDRSRYSTFTQLYEQNEMVLRQILDAKASEMTTETRAFTAQQKAVLFFKSCINVEAIEAAGSSPLDHLMSVVTWKPENGLSQPLGTSQDRLKLAEVMSILWNNEINPFIYATAGVDDKNSTRNVMFVGQSGLSLPDRSYYIGKDATKDTVLLALQKYMVDLMTLYEPAAASAAKDRALAIITFEQQLATSMASPTVLRDPSKAYNVMAVTDLETMQAFGWTNFFKKLCDDDCDVPSTVVASSLDYLHGFDAALRQTESGIIIDYLRLRVLESLAHHLTADYQTAQLSFSKTVYGVETQPTRWKLCTGRTDSAVGFALGQLYVEETFGGASRDIALDMIKDIRSTFESRLNDLDWMDAATQAKAKAKAEAVAHKIGYPADLSTSAQLDLYYGPLANIVGDTYFQNILNARTFRARKNAKKLNRPVDRTTWSMTPPTENAYYSPSYNEIVFPAGILQPPFFHQDYLHASNYGGIGVVIGHELTHGFDDQGSLYDKDGNLAPWWPSDVLEQFKLRTTCMADQYADYKLANGEHVNGNLTLGENIADNGGLVQGFNAYRSWVKKNGQGEENRLPGLSELTANQLFFVSFATVWCGDARLGEAHRLLVTDPHSPGKFRVLGTLQNSKDFVREFGCKVGSRMNPKKKCTVW
jgi:endothelin-converting enzyme